MAKKTLKCHWRSCFRFPCQRTCQNKSQFLKCSYIYWGVHTLLHYVYLLLCILVFLMFFVRNISIWNNVSVSSLLFWRHIRLYNSDIWQEMNEKCANQKEMLPATFFYTSHVDSDWKMKLILWVYHIYIRYNTWPLAIKYNLSIM